MFGGRLSRLRQLVQDEGPTRYLTVSVQNNNIASRPPADPGDRCHRPTCRRSVGPTGRAGTSARARPPTPPSGGRSPAPTSQRRPWSNASSASWKNATKVERRQNRIQRPRPPRETGQNGRRETDALSSDAATVPDLRAPHRHRTNASVKSNAEPLHSSRVEIANPIGFGGTHNHHWGPVNVPPNARPAFVVLQVQYSHALSNALYSQSLFLKFRGTSQDGTYIEQLFNATSDEKTKIMRYMEKRGISAL